MFRINFTTLAVAAIVAVGAGSSLGADPQYKKLADIQIGGSGGWDYLSADAASGRLYVSHGTKVVVIDTTTNKIMGEITNTPGVHGFVAVPDLKRGFSSNGQGNNVSIVDIDTKDDAGRVLFKTLATVTTGANPDAIMYDPKSGEVWTCNGRASTFTAIDAKTGKVVSDGVALGGKPETGQFDGDAGRAYINIENKNEVVEVDVKEHKVLNHWPLGDGATGPTGMAMDRELHRLIIGCNKMVMMDSTNGKVVATLPCGTGVDAAAFDPGTHLGFVSAGDGTVTIAKVEADKLTLVQTLKTEPGARTMTVDTKTHRIYLSNATPRNDPNAFKVLVFGMDEAKP